MAELVSGSVRPGTARLYDVKWRAFCAWCDRGRIVASQASAPVVADFLTSLQGLAPSTVEGYRSAMSETLKHLRGIDFAADPCIRGIFRNRRLTRPSERNKVPPWDVAGVLRYLSGALLSPGKGLHFQISLLGLSSCWRWCQARGEESSVPCPGRDSHGIGTERRCFVDLIHFSSPGPNRVRGSLCRLLRSGRYLTLLEVRTLTS